MDKDFYGATILRVCTTLRRWNSFLSAETTKKQHGTTWYNPKFLNHMPKYNYMVACRFLNDINYLGGYQMRLAISYSVTDMDDEVKREESGIDASMRPIVWAAAETRKHNIETCRL